MAARQMLPEIFRLRRERSAARAAGLAEGAQRERERSRVVIDALCAVRDAAMEYRLVEHRDVPEPEAESKALRVLYATLDSSEKAIRAAQAEPGGSES